MAEQNNGGRGRGRGRRGRGDGGGRGRGYTLNGDGEQPHIDATVVAAMTATMAEQGRRIQELEQLLAHTQLDESYEGRESERSSHEGEGSENPFWNWNQERRGRRQPGNQSFLANIGVKIEIPEFEGTTHPDEFIDWLHTVERVFDIRDLTEDQKVKLVAIKLRKHASIWWEHIKKQRNREGKSKIRSWDKMKKLLQQKFLHIRYRQEAFIEYYNLKQRDLSIEQYTTEFDHLGMCCDIIEEDK